MILVQHATHYDGEAEAMNFALMQLFNIIGQFKKAVIFSYSATARQSLAKADTPLSKMVTEINLHIKQKKDLQKGIKFQWVSFYSRDVGTEMSDYLAKSTAISHTSAT